MRKTLCVLLAALLLPLGAVACDLKGMSDADLKALADAVAAERQARERSVNGYICCAQVNSIFLGLKGAEVQERGSGLVLVLVMDFSHTRDHKESYLWSADTQVYQNGEACSGTYDFFHPSAERCMEEVAGGVTIEVARAFLLASRSPVTVRLDALWNWSGAQPAVVTLTLP
jgi:hypothetical protein